jgi:hypothetical protein
MKTAVFSTKPYAAKFPVAANINAAHEFDFYEEKLSQHTAKLAEGNSAICAFVNDVLNARVLDVLHSKNIRMIASGVRASIKWTCATRPHSESRSPTFRLTRRTPWRSSR